MVREVKLTTLSLGFNFFISYINMLQNVDAAAQLWDRYVIAFCWEVLLGAIHRSQDSLSLSFSLFLAGERGITARFAMWSLCPIIPRRTVRLVKSERSCSACFQRGRIRDSTTTRATTTMITCYAAPICNARIRRLDWNRYGEETEPNWLHMNGTIIMRGRRVAYA